MLLTIDTSLGLASVCISDGENILSFSNEPEPTKQAEKLFTNIDKVLKETKTEYKDLTHIVCSIGPGSFTGIRIGMAAAKGICIGLKIPFIGITTLEAIAYKNISTKMSFSELRSNSSGISSEIAHASSYQRKLVSSQEESYLDSGLRRNDESVLALIDASRKQFYSQKFSFENNMLEKISDAISIGYDDVFSEAEDVDIIISNKENEVLEKLSKENVLGSRHTGASRYPDVPSHGWIPASARMTECGISQITESNLPIDRSDEKCNLTNSKEIIISNINAKDYAELAHYKFKNNSVDFSANSPIYLREADAKPGKKFVWNE